MVLAIDNLISMYYDILKLFVDRECNINFENYREEYYQFIDNNSLEGLIEKIGCLVDAKDSVRFNVNSNLLVDKIILKVGGYNERSRC